MADLPGNSNWFQKIGNGLKNFAHNVAMAATPGAVPAMIHTEGNIQVQARREEMQAAQMKLSWLQHQENLELRVKLEEDRQVGMERLAAINHQHSTEIQKIAQQHQKELEEYRAMVQLAIQEKNIDFQKWKLQEEKELQLTIINLRHKLDLEIAKYNRETALNNIRDQRRLANSPINLVSDDLLESPYSNGDMPLRILLSPPELNSDNSGQQSLGFKFENHLAEELREFLAQNYSFNDKQRQTQLLDGAWVSKKFRGGAGIQALHSQLKAVPTIVLESEADSNYLSFRLAYWRGDGSEPIQQSILSNYPYRDFLYESVRERAKQWQKDRQILIDKKVSQEKIKMIGGNNEFNLFILQEEQNVIESGIDVSKYDDIQKQYKLSKKDFQKLHQYLISLHCLSVGLIADIHYLDREKKLIPLLPSLLPEMLKDIPNNNEFQKLILNWLIPTYDSLYEKLEEFMAGWIPELRMQFAVALSNLEDKTYAKQQGEESVNSWLRTREIKDYNRKLLKTIVTKDDRSYFESLQKFIEGIEDDSQSLALMRLLLDDWQLLDELDVISDIPYLPKLEKKTENPTDALFKQALEFQKLGKQEEAITCYDKLLEIEPNNSGACFNRGGLLCSLGKHEEAIASYDKAIQIKPDDAFIIWHMKGYVFNKWEKYQKAIDSIDKGLQIEPNNPQCWHLRGSQQKKLGHLEEAIASYNKVLQIQPDNNELLADAGFCKGDILFDLGEFAECVNSYEQALKFQPNHFHYWFKHGAILNILDETEKAIISYEKAIAIEPNNAFVWNNKGGALSSLNRYEEAIACYDTALKLQHDNASIWCNRGITLEELERYEDAVDSYEIAIRLKPNNTDNWFRLGNALIKLERYSKAISCYDALLKIDPNSSSAWNKRGAALQVLGESQQAQYSFDRADACTINGS